MLVQRGLFTIIGRQFAINGYLAMNSDGARRLIVTETFGNVMADVLVKPDGTVFVLRSSRLFPEKYIRKQMVPDLECLFGPETVTNCPATMPEPNHFIINRGWNKLDLRIVETKPGVQPAKLFDETQGAVK